MTDREAVLHAAVRNDFETFDAISRAAAFAFDVELTAGKIAVIFDGEG